MHFVVGSKNCRFAIFCFSFASSSSSRFRAGHHRHPAPLLVLLIIPCSFTTCVVPIFTAVNERIKLMIAHFLLKRKLPVKENFALHRCACVCVRERETESVCVLYVYNPIFCTSVAVCSCVLFQEQI